MDESWADTSPKQMVSKRMKRCSSSLFPRKCDLNHGERSLHTLQWLCPFLRLPHKLSGFKIILPQFWRPKSEIQVLAGHALSFLASSNNLSCLRSRCLSACSCISPTLLHCPPAVFLCLRLPRAFLYGHQSLGLRPALNPVCLNLIVSVKTPFPSRIPFISLRGT